MDWLRAEHPKRNEEVEEGNTFGIGSREEMVHGCFGRMSSRWMSSRKKKKEKAKETQARTWSLGCMCPQSNSTC
jgi:hypothetical protein